MMQRYLGWLALVIVPVVSTGCVPPSASSRAESLSAARQGFKSNLQPAAGERKAVPAPPNNTFSLVTYDAPTGKFPAYLTPDPGDGKKHPAILWITGGDCNSIGPVWVPGSGGGDQTASAYRRAGLVMMFPSLRGGNQNAGQKEGFLGEVDDVKAAGEYLAKLPYVDSKRIYLGGHSTGGTLVLLVAECSDQFRAVFSFGPVHDVSGYPPQFTPFNTRDRAEVEVRSPGLWLETITSPTFVFEGTKDGNLPALEIMAKASKNPKVRFFPVQGADHFTLLSPVNKLLAGKIPADVGPECILTTSEAEVNGTMVR